MKKRLLLTFAAAAFGTVVAMAAGFVAFRSARAGETGTPPSQFQPLVGQQPDTSSTRWKSISDDMGIMMREDDRLGLRARLYVKVNGVWRTVAVDGPADALLMIPAK